MNQLLKLMAYGIAGVALLIGSFVTFSVLTGTPMHEMKAVGGMFPENVTAEEVPGEDPNALPEPEQERDQDARSPRQVYESSSTPLSAFALQDPFSADELRKLEKRLQTKLDDLEIRSRALDERERDLVEERQHVKDMYVELVDLRTALLEQNAETEAAGEEVNRDSKVLDQRQQQIYREMASLFEDTDAPDSARMLTDLYGPEEAAQILVQLDGERVRELVTAIHAQKPDEALGYVSALKEARTQMPADNAK